MSSGASSGSSNVRERVRVDGVPKRCLCGEQVVTKIFKTETNPYRRYFHCGYAASKKLMNDNHIFKWVDEALLDEVEKLASKNARVKEDIKELLTERMKQQEMVFDRVEDALLEAKLEFNSKIKKHDLWWSSCKYDLGWCSHCLKMKTSPMVE